MDVYLFELLETEYENWRLDDSQAANSYYFTITTTKAELQLGFLFVRFCYSAFLSIRF